MTDRTILIIKTSWSYIVTQPVNPGALFYDELFKLAPGLIPMFKSDKEDQQTKFTDMITFMVLNLQNTRDIQKQINEMGKRHVGYGVTAEHYELVGTALINTLNTSLGDMWNNETRLAWTNLYDLWSSAMILASHE
ncbi:globin domain-containing protein [Dyadobacter sp. NIV53]|uniref:globin domain-containing protein n=1 Tax=Dyadobacter sp. NIV53 TaxID=2861765 RepID=UPI001C86E9D4|nr:globin domain-containing protein [Dyadobacter sp. NIV53]